MTLEATRPAQGCSLQDRVPLGCPGLTGETRRPAAAPQKASPSATGRGALTPACRPPQIWWLDPELTYGSAKPFVFTQGHSVCNRSFFPCFDTPAVKCTYSAVVKVSAHRPGRPSHDPPGPPPGRRPRSSPRGRHCPAGGPAPVWVLIQGWVWDPEKAGPSGVASRVRDLRAADWA